MSSQFQRRDEILHATVFQIESAGESSVRLRDISRIVGITEPTMYHYFHNREQLIIAAHAYRFKVNLTETLGPFVSRLSECTSADEFLEALLMLYRISFPKERIGVRATRAEIVGASIKRPQLRKEIAAMTEELLRPAVELLKDAQSRGWIRSGVSVEAFAFWNLGNITGLIFAEMLADEATQLKCHEFWLESVELVVRGLKRNAKN